jgi:hypothetical protein
MMELIDWGTRCRICKQDVMHRCKKVFLDTDVLTTLFKDKLPEGCELILIDRAEFGIGFIALVSHSEWDVVPEGQTPPEAMVTYRRNDDGSTTIESIE